MLELCHEELSHCVFSVFDLFTVIKPADISVVAALSISQITPLIWEGSATEPLVAGPYGQTMRVTERGHSQRSPLW